MRVLMFGWEFPPYISGGLGSACEGMVRALTGRGTQVIFVVPKLLSGEGADEPGGLSMRSASGIVVPGGGGGSEKEIFTDTRTFFKKNLKLEYLDSSLTPYITPQTYAKTREELERGQKTTTGEKTVTWPGAPDVTLTLHGGYGKDLLSEVYRYSLAAQVLARRENFDVIHCHDWMTYPAGIMAKRVSGKPLVVHVHATEADRSGEHMNPVVSHIEWEGMTAADRVVCVSHFTKNLVMRV